MKHQRHDGDVKKGRLAFIAFLLVIILVGIVGKMDSEDEQSMTEYTCAMIAEGTWPADVADEGECE